MTVKERIRMSLILEEMKKNRVTADILGLRDISKITDRTSDKEKSSNFRRGEVNR